jgi:hypothetical protein
LNYAKLNDDKNYWAMSDSGMQWLGPFTIKEDEAKFLNLELETLTLPLRNNWSVIVWAEKEVAKIQHLDKIISDIEWNV